MDLNHALHTIAEKAAGDTEAAEAVATVRDVIVGLQHRTQEISVEHEALKRVCYLLVMNVQDDQIKDEMHATYTRMAAGLTTPDQV